MKKQGLVKNIIQVTISNIITIIAGVIVGLVLPKVISVADYGWYKTFSLYTTYVGFCSLGIIDGIVLRFGGHDFEDIDKPLFRGYFRWYFLIHCFFAVLLVILAAVVEDPNYKFIWFTLGLYMIMVNCSGYFQQISQITQRFREYSFRKILFSILKILVVVILFILEIIDREANYKIYIVLLLVNEIILTGWYFYTYREIVFGKADSLPSVSKDILSLSKIGFPLLFANLCSTLILSLDRQFVRLLFETEVYAKYSFAYNMLSLVTVAMSAVSTVIYPTLKRTTEATLQQTYSTLVSIISMFVFGAVALYYPLCVFVNWFLPKYSESLPIFRIVFPGLAISSSITVIMHNYYKALGLNNKYFGKSIVVLIVSGMTNGFAYYAFHTTAAISIASIITMVFWYLYIDQYFVNAYGYNRNRNLSYLLIMMFVFYFVSAIPNYYIGFTVYILIYMVLTWNVFRDTIKTELPQILNR